MAQVVGKYLVPVHSRILAEGFHFLPDIAAIHGLAGPGHKDAARSDPAFSDVGLQLTAQLDRQDHRTGLAF